MQRSLEPWGIGHLGRPLVRQPWGVGHASGRPLVRAPFPQHEHGRVGGWALRVGETHIDIFDAANDESPERGL